MSVRVDDPIDKEYGGSDKLYETYNNEYSRDLRMVMTYTIR